MDYVLLAAIITAIGGVCGALFAKSKLDGVKTDFMAILDDMISMLMFGHQIATKEIPADATNLSVLASMIEKVWEDLKTLGPVVKALLEAKEPA